MPLKKKKQKHANYSLEKKPEKKRKKRPYYVNILFHDGLCCSALCSELGAMCYYDGGPFPQHYFPSSHKI